jgi:hypothetical protein
MNISPIIQNIFNKNTLQEVDATAVQQLNDKYPFFAISQLLLLKKQQANDISIAPQSTKTYLHFSNPLWLHWLLQQNEAETNLQTTTPLPAETEAPDNDELVIDITAHNNNTQLQKPGEETVFEKPGETINNNEEIIAVANEDAPAEDELPAVTAATEGDENKPFAMRAIPSLISTKETFVQPQADELVFEPYHTIDYFASQGIKITGIVNSDDRFGKQLKSFTQWLKTMQRLPQATIEKSLDDSGSEKVMAMAQTSLDSKEIITESMAEVLAKQGLTQRAREIYKKLSLLDPAKSHYFAAKIEDLK